MPITASGGELNIMITLQTNAEGVVSIVKQQLVNLGGTVTKVKNDFAAFGNLPQDGLRQFASNAAQAEQAAKKAGAVVSTFGSQLKQTMASGAPIDLRSIEETQKKVNSLNTRFSAFSSTLRDNALSFGIASASVWGLFNAFDNLERVQLSTERIQIQAARLRNTATAAEERYNKQLSEGKLTAEQAATGSDKLRVMRERASVSTRIAQDQEEEYQKTIAGFATQVVPLVVAAGGSIVQMFNNMQISMKDVRGVMSTVGSAISGVVTSFTSMGAGLGSAMRVGGIGAAFEMIKVQASGAKESIKGLGRSMGDFFGTKAGALTIAGAAAGIGLLVIKTNAFGVTTALDNMGEVMGNQIPVIREFLQAIRDTGDALLGLGDNASLLAALKDPKRFIEELTGSLAKIGASEGVFDKLINVTDSKQFVKNILDVNKAIEQGLTGDTDKRIKDIAQHWNQAVQSMDQSKMDVKMKGQIQGVTSMLDTLANSSGNTADDVKFAAKIIGEALEEVFGINIEELVDPLTAAFQKGIGPGFDFLIAKSSEAKTEFTANWGEIERKLQSGKINFDQAKVGVEALANKLFGDDELGKKLFIDFANERLDLLKKKSGEAEQKLAELNEVTVGSQLRDLALGGGDVKGVMSAISEDVTTKANQFFNSIKAGLDGTELSANIAREAVEAYVKPLQGSLEGRLIFDLINGMIDKTIIKEKEAIDTTKQLSDFLATLSIPEKFATMKLFDKDAFTGASDIIKKIGADFDGTASGIDRARASAEMWVKILYSNSVLAEDVLKKVNKQIDEIEKNTVKAVTPMSQLGSLLRTDITLAMQGFAETTRAGASAGATFFEGLRAQIMNGNIDLVQARQLAAAYTAQWEESPFKTAFMEQFTKELEDSNVKLQDNINTTEESINSANEYRAALQQWVTDQGQLNTLLPLTTANLELMKDAILGDVEAQAQLNQMTIEARKEIDAQFASQALLSQELLTVVRAAGIGGAEFANLAAQIRNNGTVTDDVIIKWANAAFQADTLRLAVNAVGLSAAQMAVAMAQGANAAVAALQNAATQAIITNQTIAGMTSALTAAGLNLGAIQKATGQDFLGVSGLSTIARAAHGDQEALAQLAGQIQSTSDAQTKASKQAQKNKIDEKKIREQAVQEAIKEVALYSSVISKNIEETKAIRELALEFGVAEKELKKFNKGLSEFDTATNKAQISLLKLTLTQAENIKYLRSQTQHTKDLLNAQIEGARSARDFELQTRMNAAAGKEEQKILEAITRELGIRLPSSMKPTVENLQLLIEAAYGSKDALDALKEESAKVGEVFRGVIDDAKNAIREGHFSDFVKRELLFFQGADEFTGKITLRVESEMMLEDTAEQLKKQLALISASPDLFNKTVNDQDLKAGVQRTLDSLNQSIGSDPELQARWKPITDALKAVLTAPDTSEALVSFANKFPDMIGPAVTGVDLQLKGLDTTINQTLKKDGDEAAKVLKVSLKDVGSEADKIEKALLKVAKASQSVAASMQGAGRSFKSALAEAKKLVENFKEQIAKTMEGITSVMVGPSGGITVKPKKPLTEEEYQKQLGQVKAGVQTGLIAPTPVPKTAVKTPATGGVAGGITAIAGAAATTLASVQTTLVQITGAVKTAFDGLITAATPGLLKLATGFRILSDGIPTWGTSHLLPAITTIFNGLITAATPGLLQLAKGFVVLSDGIKSQWGSGSGPFFTAVKSAFDRMPTAAVPGFVAVGKGFIGLSSSIQTQWGKQGGPLYNAVKSSFDRMPAAATNGFISISGPRGMFNGLSTFVSSSWGRQNGPLYNAVKASFDRMPSAATNGFTALTRMFNALEGQARTATNKVNAAISNNLKTSYTVTVNVQANDPNNLLPGDVGFPTDTGLGATATAVTAADTARGIALTVPAPIKKERFNVSSFRNAEKERTGRIIRQILLKLDIPLTIDGKELGRWVRDHVFEYSDNEL